VKLVVDSNVLISGLLWHGPPHRLIEQARAGKTSFFSSPALLAELADVLTRERFSKALASSRSEIEQILGEVQSLVVLVRSVALPSPVCRDPDDDELLAAALAAQADLIVSGDRDLLALVAFQGIPIVSPAQALERIEAAAR
jgi:putative PIN family toxin of toxin-antitoxin system